MLKSRNPLLRLDMYKTEHMRQYPEGTTFIRSNHTARKSRIPGIDRVIFFGVNNALATLHEEWEYFKENRELCLSEYSEVIGSATGVAPDLTHLRRLNGLDLTIMALPEGTSVPIGVPMMTIQNTTPESFFLPQMIESDLSSRMWMAVNSATIAVEMRRRLNKALETSGGPVEMAPYLNHDFSYRGMAGEEAAIMSGLGHLVGSNGTDTVLAIKRVNELYGKYAGASIAATEHSVMCVDGEDLEYETFERLLRLYPHQPIAVVSDTWNLWRVVGDYIPRLGGLLTARKAPLVIRPDSGSPCDILMGDARSSEGIARQGLGPFLLERFSGSRRFTPKGYQLLPCFVGTVYGDAMTMERCDELSERMLAAGICPSNTVRGVGSFTYQYNTRDTFGQAFKATEAVVEGEHRELFKDPITSDGEKKSLRGRVGVRFDTTGRVVGSRDRLSENDDAGFYYMPMHWGKLRLSGSFDDIRRRTGVWD